MEIPSKVSVFNPTLDIKGKTGTLIAIGERYYEISIEFKERYHTVLFPIAGTVLVFTEPLPQAEAEFEIER